MSAVRRLTRPLTVLLAAVVVAFIVPSPAAAVPAQGVTAAQIAEELAASGRYLEVSADGGVDRAIDDANARGTAFVWLDSSDDATEVAEIVLDELIQFGTSYRTVLVLTDVGVGASSETVSISDLDGAIDLAFTDFANGAVADGLDVFTAALSGDAATTASTTSPGSTTSADTSAGSSGGGISIFPILAVLVVGGGGFWFVRRLRNRSKARKQEAADMEADRAEIQEQLRSNADHVLTLGDLAIASGDAELIALYEQASATYQDVSHAVDGASTPAEIDALDDRIDEAEWQFESIEARLEGRPEPPSPAEVQAQAEAAAQAEADAKAAGGPALGPDESVFGDGPSRPRGAPGRTRYQAPRSRRRSGGLGGGLGGALGSVILGGGLGGGLGGRSRRSTRRSGGLGSTRSTGGLGGGVLRPSGGGSRSRRSSSGRRFGSGGRSSSGRRF